MLTRAHLKAATEAAFFVAGLALLPIGVAAIYQPAGLITAGVEAICAAGYMRGAR